MVVFLQSVVTSLEHPNKLLHSIFEIIYDKDVVCEVRSKSVQTVSIRLA